MKTNLSTAVLAAFLSMVAVSPADAAPGTIQVDAARKLVTLADGQSNLVLRLNYDDRCILDQVIVRGRPVAAESGVAGGVRRDGKWLTTRAGIPSPKISAGKDTLTVKNIVFGPPGAEIHETWKFSVQPDRILWRITRRYPAQTVLDDSAFPEWDFSNMSTWTGGLLGNGGVVWNKYLETPNATYGAHTGEVTFWSREHGDCLRIISAMPKNKFGAVRFSHQPGGIYSFNFTASDEELQPRHDLRRWLPKQQDLWAPFKVQPGEVTAEFSLQALDYDSACNRGTFRGLDGRSVRELLNTIGRYGVVDSRLIGGNGWRTGYICLHEQWFAQIGLALDDPEYTSDFAATLDYERDHAIQPDGRVLSRWDYNAGDAMRGTFTKEGYYEAQWGYLLDSQPDYVICVAEQFDLAGDRRWLAGQKAACEHALDYLVKREVPGTGLAAMITDSTAQHRSSDWIDIIWASYENALVNAEFYRALCLWADAEDNLGDHAHAESYRAFAGRLKTTFNRSIDEGGFWDPKNQWYIYWRDKDGSVHGNNLCMPVNFAAISYGICDDPGRKKAILDRMESEMQKENLFTWPLNFFPYPPEEGAAGNFPYPKYENGDIFLSWAELGVRAYADYKPEIAVKYVKQTLARYETDGLSFQRYLRNNQQGAGNDILAGNCMAIVGLYRDIYGIQPLPNRLYLLPHLTAELAGTRLRYQLRGRDYEIGLDTNICRVNAGACALLAAPPFAVNATGHALEFFPGGNTNWAMSLAPSPGSSSAVEIESWPDDPDAVRRWTQSSSSEKGKTAYIIAGLRPNALYELQINESAAHSYRTDQNGRARFAIPSTAIPQDCQLVLKAP